MSFTLFIAWTLSGYCRYLEYRKVLRRQAESKKKTIPTDVAKPMAVAPPEQNVREWPPISVVLPVKGVRAHALEYWDSQISCAYGGPIEFIFVVDTREDAAHAALEELRRRMEAEGRAAGSIRIHVAGPCSTCSQKIFNQVSGFRAASHDSK